MDNNAKKFSFSRNEAEELLLGSYQSYFNIHRFDGGESAVREGSPAKGMTDELVMEVVRSQQYPLLARCDFFEHSQKYVLSKKAELWSADSEEFLYLFSVPRLTVDLFERCRKYVYEDGMERLNSGPGHMYTYLTAVFLCDSCDEDAYKALKKTRIYKSFHFSLNGWMDYRNVVAAFDNSLIGSNYSGRSAAKFMKKILFTKRKKES